MCDDEQGLRPGAEDLRDHPAAASVERGARLVEGQDAGLHAEHGGQRGPALLAAAEMVGGPAGVDVS